MFFSSLISPLAFAAILAILINRFGYPGLLIIGLTIMLVPLQALIGKMNSVIIRNANIYKDNRINVCMEIIQGIKFIKLYGW